MRGFRVTIRSSWADVAATTRWLERNGLAPRWQVVEVLCDAEGSALITRHLRPVELFYVNDGPVPDGFVLARHRVALRHLPPPHIVEAGPPAAAGPPIADPDLYPAAATVTPGPTDR